MASTFVFFFTIIFKTQELLKVQGYKVSGKRHILQGYVGNITVYTRLEQVKLGITNIDIMYPIVQ